MGEVIIEHKGDGTKSSSANGGRRGVCRGPCDQPVHQLTRYGVWQHVPVDAQHPPHALRANLWELCVMPLWPYVCTMTQ